MRGSGSGRCVTGMRTRKVSTSRFNQSLQEDVMNTVPVSVARERISEGAPLGTSKTRRVNLFRSLVALMLAGAAVLGHMSPAHAAQPVAPFGIPCDSVGVSGIPYVPGVNCRLMAVDGYTRHYVGVGAVFRRACQCPGSDSCSMEQAATAGSSCARPVGEKRRRRNISSAIFPTAVEHFVLENQSFSTRWNNLRPSGPDRSQSAASWLSCDLSLARRRRDVHPSNRG